MPRPVHAMGRPSTSVIPDDWQATHQPVGAATHTCPVELFHSVDDNDDTMSWDPATEQMVPAAREAFWEGPARVQALALRGEPTREIVGDEVTVVAYQVTLTALEDIPVRSGDVVRIAPSYADDPLLAGRSITITQVIRGSQRFERLLYGQLVDDAPR